MTYPIARYLNVQQAYDPNFIDDDQIAFVSTITGMPQVWRVGLDLGQGQILWPDQYTFGSDRVLGVWSSPVQDGRRLIYARDVGGNENAQLFLLGADGSQETALTEGYEQSMHTFGEWSADGTQIVFAANRRHPGIFDLFLQPLDGEARMVWQNDQLGFLQRQTFAPDGKHVAVSRMASSFSHDLFEIDLHTGAAQHLTSGDEDARYEQICYAPDGRSLFVVTDRGSDFLHLARLDLQTLALEPIVTPDWDVELLACSPDGRFLAYTVNDDGQSSLHLFDLQTGTTRQAPNIGTAPGVVGWLDGKLSFAPDSRQLAFSFTSSTRTSDLYVWDFQTDHVHAVTRSSHGGLPTDTFAAPTLIRYPSFDGRDIPAWLYQPATDDQEPRPAIVVVHGGPESQFRPFFHFFVQYFVQHGYAVLAPNVRGSTGYGKHYSHLDDVRKRMDSVADLAHAARWLQQQSGIDNDRLVVYGGSYGGFMVLAALTTNPELWAAGVDVVGISNFVTFLERTSEYRRAHREAEYGSLERDREFLEQISPMNHLDAIQAPLMVIHGANDPRVPLNEAEQVVAALQQRGIPVEFLVFDDEGHGIVKLHNKLVAYPAILDFLRTHLEIN